MATITTWVKNTFPIICTRTQTPQKNITKNKLTVYIEALDGKEISDNTRMFIQKMCTVKAARLKKLIDTYRQSVVDITASAELQDDSHAQQNKIDSKNGFNIPPPKSRGKFHSPKAKNYTDN